MTLPSLIHLATNWRPLAAESATADRSQYLDISRAGKTHDQVAAEIVAAGRPGWVESGIHGWLNWGICIGDRFPVDCGLPLLSEALGKCRGIRVAALSLFEPGCTLPTHNHPELTGRFLTFHLGLSGPHEGCGLWTEGRYLTERPGSWFVFDGSRPHYAFNATTEERVILYVEFDRG